MTAAEAAMKKVKTGPDAKETAVSAGTKNIEENRVKKDPKEPRGVVYIGHLPAGFFEPQMREFLSQFGTVTRLRLSRSKKNAHSKGYAFVEFDDEGVAQIVAETVDKYLLFGRQLKAHIVPAEKRHPAIFRGANKRMVPLDRKRKALQRLQHNKKRGDDRDGDFTTPAVTVRQQSRRLKKEKRKRGALAGAGIDYDFEGWEEQQAGAAAAKPKPKPKSEKGTAAAAASGASSAPKTKSPKQPPKPEPAKAGKKRPLPEAKGVGTQKKPRKA